MGDVHIEFATWIMLDHFDFEMLLLALLTCFSDRIEVIAWRTESGTLWLQQIRPKALVDTVDSVLVGLLGGAPAEVLQR